MGVIASILVTSMALFGILIISGSMMNAIDRAAAAGKETGRIIMEKSLTSVDAATASYDTGGGHSWVIMKNDGHTDLGDWEKWDVFIHYNPPGNSSRRYLRLTYDSSYPPGNDQWSTNGIYLDQANTIPEEFEKGRLNPGEYVKIALKVSQSIKNSTWVFIKASTPNGANDNIQYLK